MNSRAGRRVRCVAVGSGATAAVTGVATALLTAGGLGAPAAAGGAIARLCTVVLLAGMAWGWAAVLAGVAEAWRLPAAVATGAPAGAEADGVRRWVLAACGVALTTAIGAAAPAHADPAPPHPVLSGLPMPERATGPARPAGGRVVVVRAGDCLWGIAARQLGGGEHWRELYRRNRTVVGADPDLIRPGTRLALPAEPSAHPSHERTH